MLENIAALDSKEAGVLIPQLMQVHVFDDVYDLVLECFIRCAHIVIDSPFLVMWKLEVIS